MIQLCSEHKSRCSNNLSVFIEYLSLPGPQILVKSLLGQSKPIALLWKPIKEAFERVDIYRRMCICLDEGFEAAKHQCC